MSTANLDAADLAAALTAPGLIAEDVVQTVYNLDRSIPTPFTDMLSGGNHDAPYAEHTEDDLPAVDINNAVVDGADASGNNATVGRRLGNRQQLADKVVRVSDVSERVTSFGGMGKLAYQTAKMLAALRRDVEGITLGRQASQEDDGASTPGKTGALGAYLATNTSFGSGGSAGGFNTGTKVVGAPTEGTIRALTWEGVRDQLENIYTAGANPSVLMSVPKVLKRINNFLFSDGGTPYRATPTANVGSSAPSPQTAQGYISVVLSDFNISLSLVDNRLQQTYNSGTAADVFICDPAYAGITYLDGYRNKMLGATGHAENSLLAVEFMLRVYREDAHAMIADVDPTAAVTAS